MITCRGLLRAALLILAVMVALQARATPFVTFRTIDLGGGLFEYDLTLTNTGGGEALSGLIVVNGNSVFGLDEASVIDAPDGWSFFPPLPLIFDPLFYFSGSSATDVAADGSLSGFAFESSKDPALLLGSDFEVIGIGAIFGQQIPLGNAQPVPEPPSVLLLAFGLTALLRLARCDNKERLRQ